MDVLLTTLLNPTPEMLAEKLFHRAIKLKAVLLVREAMSFIRFDNVGDFDASGLQRLDHLI